MGISKLGIGILPDKETKRLIIKMSKSLKSVVDTSYLIDGKKFCPHLSLYQSKFEDFPKVIQIISSLAHKYPRGIPVTLSSLGLFSGSFVFYDCSKTKILQKIHESIVEQLKDISIKINPVGEEQNLIGLTNREITNMKEYGYPFVKDSFRPHFTIGRTLKSISLGRIKEILGLYESKSANHSFISREIIIYELGIDGGCTNILKKFNLK